MIFAVQDDEQIIENRDNNSIKELIAAMEEQRGKKLFVICQMNYDSVHPKLAGRGFKEYTDYVNGLSFMTRNQCGYTRPEWDLISNM